MSEQFFTTCKYCGKQILMTKNLENHSWVACEPEIFRFRPSLGTTRYVTPEGNIVRGDRDRNGVFGYRKHERCVPR